MSEMPSAMPSEGLAPSPCSLQWITGEPELRFASVVVSESDRHEDRVVGSQAMPAQLIVPQHGDAEEGARPQMTPPDDLCEKTKKRCVGILDDKAVYFVGTRMGFHLAVECCPSQFRRLSEVEHLRFRKQSRVEGLCYGQYWEEEP